jgi:hypothetical protein
MMGDPKYWDMDLHGKLCFLLGWLQGNMPGYAVEYPSATQPSEELVDAIIRMLARKNGNMEPNRR